MKRRVQSTCNYCALDCNMDFYGGRKHRQECCQPKGYPVNDGFCCIKGLSLDKQQTVVKTSPLPKIRRRTDHEGGVLGRRVLLRGG